MWHHIALYLHTNILQEHAVSSLTVYLIWPHNHSIQFDAEDGGIVFLQSIDNHL
jgi:hypothetical protein